MSSPRVLFVSKPVAPPWNDGSKNLVRDVATHLERARPTVLSVGSPPDLGARVAVEPLYRDTGRFAPALAANARVARRLLTGDPHDLWHFVFAPNPRSSSVARIARGARRLSGWRGAVVQTVASAPRSFDAVSKLLFGDAVIALSEHTARRLCDAGAERSRLHVIPPCALAPRARDAAEREAIRARLGLGDGPCILYPGDYEVSRGAATVAGAVPALLDAVPGATVVFACRKKTPAADAAQARVERAVADRGARIAARTLHLGEVRDMSELLAVASIVVFPVDELYGKVDLPLVVLEAMALGVPIVVARGGPLDALDFAPSIAPGDSRALADVVVPLLRDEGARRVLGEAGARAYEARYTPTVVARAYDAIYRDVL